MSGKPYPPLIRRSLDELTVLSDEEIDEVVMTYLREEGMDDADEFEWTVDEDDRAITQAQLQHTIKELKEMLE